MSYTIEYNRKVFYLPKGTEIPEGYGKTKHQLWEDELFLFIKQGCNNIRPRPKTWHLPVTGWNYTIIKEVCDRAGETEGGSLQFQNGYTTPENYIKMYRKAIAEKEILTPESLKQWGCYGFEIAIGPKQPEDYYLKSIETLKEKGQYMGVKYDKYHIYQLPVSMDGIIAYMNLSHLAKETNGWLSLDHSDNI